MLTKIFTTNIKSENIGKLTQCSRLVDEILNRKPNQHMPYVGASAFSHKGGLHVSAVQKDPKTYEHIKPELVGNTRNIVVSDQAGKSNIISRLKSIGVDFKEEDLLENLKAFYDTVSKSKPESSNGSFIKRVTIASTMGFGLKINAGSLR